MYRTGAIGFIALAVVGCSKHEAGNPSPVEGSGDPAAAACEYFAAAFDYDYQTFDDTLREMGELSTGDLLDSVNDSEPLAKIITEQQATSHLKGDPVCGVQSEDGQTATVRAAGVIETTNLGAPEPIEGSQVVELTMTLVDGRWLASAVSAG